MASIAANRRPTSRYRAPDAAWHAPPAPPGEIAPAPAFRAPPPLWQFVILSMLVHAIFIALFGAPSGGSREGRAMWGSMQLELRGLLVDAQRAPLAPAAEAVPREMPAPAREDRGPAEGAVPLTPPIDTPAPAVAPSGPAIVEVPTPFPPVIDRLVSPAPRLDEPPPLKVPLPTEGRDLRPPPRERPAPSPIDVPTPLPLAPAPRSERALGDAPLISAPLAQPVPAPTPDARIAPPPAEAPAVRPAPVTRPVEIAPIEVPAIPVPPLEGLAPSRTESATPVDMTPMPEVRAAPAAPPPVPEAAPREAPTPAERSDRETPRAPADLRAPPLPGTAPRAAPGRAGDSSSSYDPTAPALDIDALRKRAGQIAREGSGQRALLPFPMPAVPEKKTKMEAAIENARKPDCRTAYQGMGLLAVVPLLANEIGEGTCRW